MRPFPAFVSDPESAPQDAPSNFVSTATVGHDPKDPSRAFMFIDRSGQVLVEVTIDNDGDKVQAYLCLEQSGPNAGGFVPVAAGDAVLLAWPDGDSGSLPYIIGRMNNRDDPLAPTVAGIQTTGPNGQVRVFRWMVTPNGQVYAIAPGGELLLHGGAAGVRIKGAQVVIDGPTHLGADFATQPVPGHVAGGAAETPATPAGPFVPPQGATLTSPPWVGNRDALVRVTDGVQSNTAIDPTFWAWKQALEVYLLAVDVFIQALSSLNPALIVPALGVYQTAVQIWNATPSPTALESQHKSASKQHTASD